MSIHFAAANSSSVVQASSPNARMLKVRAQAKVANDNVEFGSSFAQGAAPNAQHSDLVVRAALRHFAAHGLGAAKVARAQAEKAFFKGDRDTYDWWVGITRTLDRRLAASVSGQKD